MYYYREVKDPNHLSVCILKDLKVQLFDLKYNYLI